MRQIIFKRTSNPKNLKVSNEEVAIEPKAGEVVIDVKAAGLNFIDILARLGQLHKPPKGQHVSGFELSGDISAVGEGVDESRIGESVIAVTNYGAHAEKVAVPVSNVFHLPRRLNYEDGAALPISYMAAYLLIIEMGRVRKDETVLIHNVGGAVGLAAMELAHNLGAHVIGTASGKKHTNLEDRYIDKVADYTRHDWTEELAEYAGKVDLVLDPIGGPNLEKSFNFVKSTGRIAVYGEQCRVNAGLDGSLKYFIGNTGFGAHKLMRGCKGVFGIDVLSLFDDKDKLAYLMGKLLEMVENREIAPVVDRVVSFHQIALAHQTLESRNNIGKVILVP